MEVGKLRSDSPHCRRVVLAFLDFLKSVEPAPGVDLEGIDVARECLEEVFKLNQSSIHDESDDRAVDLHPVGMLKDELFGKFFAALDKTNFFKTSTAGVDDPVQVSKATQLYNDALTELENSPGQTVNLSSIAEILKSKGNKSMQLKLYSEAVELYTCAIALCEKNAVYYCNRAAAYTQLQRYTEATEDCLKSIEIDPKYSKAYSRLGVAYYSQGNYVEALNQGFLKALQLDPSNSSVKESILEAQHKLLEQNRQAGARNTGASHFHESDTHSAGSANHSASFTSIPIHASITPDFANVFRNMASSGLGNQSRERTPSGNTEETHEPRISVDVNLNTGEVCEGISDTLRSITEMLSQQQRPQGNRPRGGDQT